MFTGIGVRNVRQTWSDAISRFEDVKWESAADSAAMRAMLLLCRHIAAGPLASGLFVTTSMFDLCITQTPVDNVFDAPYLRISPLRDGRIELRYVDTMVRADQWHRTVEPAEALPRLLKFLDQMHWFPSEMLQS